MTAEVILFYVFGTLAVVSALGMVLNTRNTVASAMSLVVTMVSLGAIYLLLEAYLVAAIQIMVYGGAIVVVFLFVVMLLNIGRESTAVVMPSGTRRLGALLVIGFAVELAWALSRTGSLSGRSGAVPVPSTVQEIGVTLFTTYGFAFEVTAVLTLVAMLGAVVLTKRGPKDGAP